MRFITTKENPTEYDLWMMGEGFWYVKCPQCIDPAAFHCDEEARAYCTTVRWRCPVCRGPLRGPVLGDPLRKWKDMKAALLHGRQLSLLVKEATLVAKQKKKSQAEK